MSGDPRKRTVHWGVQAVVLFHLFAIVTWTLPEPPPHVMQDDVEFKLRDAPNYLLKGNKSYIKESPIKYYMITTGIWQYWNMFSPNPANVDVWFDATVTFEDGKQLRYQYPRMKPLPVHVKYFRERYRKFVENTQPDYYAYKWPPIAQRVAYLTYEGEDNLPVTVELRRHVKTVLTPADGEPYLAQGPASPDDYVTQSFFFYQVDQEKLLRHVAQ